MVREVPVAREVRGARPGRPLSGRRVAVRPGHLHAALGLCVPEVVRALARVHGNLSKAADLLGVSRPTLYDLLNRFGLR